jgi:hypothetical protein
MCHDTCVFKLAILRRLGRYRTRASSAPPPQQHQGWRHFRATSQQGQRRCLRSPPVPRAFLSVVTGVLVGVAAVHVVPCPWWGKPLRSEARKLEGSATQLTSTALRSLHSPVQSKESEAGTTTAHAPIKLMLCNCPVNLPHNVATQPMQIQLASA